MGFQWIGRSILVWAPLVPQSSLPFCNSYAGILGRVKKSWWWLQLCFNVQLPSVPSGWSPPFPALRSPSPQALRSVSGSTPKAGRSRGHYGRGLYRMKWRSPYDEAFFGSSGFFFFTAPKCTGSQRFPPPIPGCQREGGMPFSPLPSAGISGETSACLVLLAAIFSPWPSGRPSAAWASGEPCCHPFPEQDFATGDGLEGDAAERLLEEQAREARAILALPPIRNVA